MTHGFLSARGAPGLLIKSVGKGAIRAHLKDGRDVVLQPGEQENDYLERTAAEDLIVLDDNVTQVTKTDIAMDEPRTGIMTGEPLELDLIDMGDKTVPVVNMRNE